MSRFLKFSEWFFGCLGFALMALSTLAVPETGFAAAVNSGYMEGADCIKTCKKSFCAPEKRFPHRWHNPCKGGCSESEVCYDNCVCKEPQPRPRLPECACRDD
jgi:hypothetical protein